MGNSLIANVLCDIVMTNYKPNLSVPMTLKRRSRTINMELESKAFKDEEKR